MESPLRLPETLPCNRRARLNLLGGQQGLVTAGTQQPLLKYVLGVNELFPNTLPRAGQSDLNISRYKVMRA